MTKIVCCLSLLCGIVLAGPVSAQATVAANDTTPRFFFRFAYSFQPDRVMGEADSLEIASGQREDMARQVQRAAAAFRPLRQAQARYQELLDAPLSKRTVDEDRVMAALDQMLEVEAQIKRLQMHLLLSTYATLNPTQRREALQRLRRTQ